jgi:hypothetical protein
MIMSFLLVLALVRRKDLLLPEIRFTIAHGQIVAIDVLADPEQLSRLGGVAG